MSDEFWLKKFPIGTEVHIGYCTATIIGISKLKGFGPTIKLTPKKGEPRGAYRNAGKVFDVSYSAMQDWNLKC